MSRRIYIYSALSLVGLLLGACTAAQAAPLSQAEEPADRQRTIAVSGTGRVTLTPDLARISVGVQNDGEDAAAAVAENNQRTAEVIKTLGRAGIAEEDIQTTNFSIYPQEERDRDGKLISIRYVVNNTVQITVRDLEQVGEILDAVVSSGANTVAGIEFDITDRSAASENALKAAVADAQAQAEILADAAGVQLGSVQSISTLVTGGITPPFVRNEVVAFAAADVPISPGQMEIVIQVQVIFGIQ